jgi:hypothetical protein
MAGPLKKADHEKFCQLVAAGSSPSDAYTAIGRRAGNKNEYTFKNSPTISARIDEIRAERDRVITEVKEVGLRSVKAAIRQSTFDAVKALTRAADLALNEQTLTSAIRFAAEKGDAKGLIAAGVEALKLREVLSGNVSDRVETVTDGLTERLAEVDRIISNAGRSVRESGDLDALEMGRAGRQSTH